VFEDPSQEKKFFRGKKGEKGKTLNSAQKEEKRGRRRDLLRVGQASHKAKYRVYRAGHQRKKKKKLGQSSDETKGRKKKEKDIHSYVEGQKKGGGVSTGETKIPAAGRANPSGMRKEGDAIPCQEGREEV